MKLLLILFLAVSLLAPSARAVGDDAHLKVTANGLNKSLYRAILDGDLTNALAKRSVRFTTNGVDVNLSTLDVDTNSDWFQVNAGGGGGLLVAGDRIIAEGQVDSTQNGIYVIQQTGPAVRATDFDYFTKINGAMVAVYEGSYAGRLYVLAGPAVVTVGADAINFSYMSPGISGVIGGDMIAVTGTTISVDLATTSGLVSDNPGNVAGKLKLKLEASNPSLQIDGSNQVGVKLNAAGAVVKGASGVAVQLETTNPSLQIATNALGVKLNAANGAIVKNSSGVSLQIENTNASLKISSNRVGVNLDPAGAITSPSPAGLVVGTDGSTIEISGNVLQLVLASISDQYLTNGLDVVHFADGSVTNTVFQYIGTLTSDAQGQLDAKASLAGATFTGQIEAGPGSNIYLSDPSVGSLSSLAQLHIVGGSDVLMESSPTGAINLQIINGGAGSNVYGDATQASLTHSESGVTTGLAHANANGMDIQGRFSATQHDALTAYSNAQGQLQMYSSSDGDATAATFNWNSTSMNMSVPVGSGDPTAATLNLDPSQFQVTVPNGSITLNPTTGNLLSTNVSTQITSSDHIYLTATNDIGITAAIVNMAAPLKLLSFAMDANNHQVNNLAPGTAPGDAISFNQIQAFTSGASAGGSATETFVVTGLLATDQIFSVTVKNNPGLTPYLSFANQANDAIDVTFTADPGAGATIIVAVKR